MVDVVRQRSNFNRCQVIINVNVSNVHVHNNIMGIATNSLHGLVAFIFYVLIGFLQICYPDNPTVFQLHPKTMLVSIASFLLYSLAFWVKLKFDTTRIDTLMEVFGSLSIISLVLMFFPHNWGLFGYIIIYTLWFIYYLLVLIIGLRQHMHEKEVATTLPNASIV
ncbi:hypothetical protein MtrunA17_Chr2g0297111 [Medicago truncatula]|uniref:Transmembrane protein n=1 Tax=Medicago truncatula TaxID=3880 RepID=A0A396J8J9_MEDTR|nr:hypothetical protein MtrunA17_Chr2g0297111 [Medicago truncatula]